MRIRLTQTKALIVSRKKRLNEKTALATDKPIYSKRLQIAHKTKKRK